MARREADREDIMREAIALRKRIAFKLPDTDEPVVCGVRANGNWSFYLDPDRVYQFNDELRLRRAYVAGFLYRTQGNTLARMHRERSETETVLARSDLGDEELTAFLNDMHDCLTRILDVLLSGEARIVESIPVETDVRGELLSAMKRLLECPLELAPAIKARH